MNNSLKLYNAALAKGYSMNTNDPNAEFLIICGIQKWLIDEHKIYIAVGPMFDKFSVFVVHYKENGVNKGPSTIASHDTWYEAFFAGIEIALELL